MEYDRGNSFPFDFESNRNPFGPKSKGKQSPRSYPIQYERKWNYSFLSLTSESGLQKSVKSFAYMRSHISKSITYKIDHYLNN